MRVFCAKGRLNRLDWQPTGGPSRCVSASQSDQGDPAASRQERVLPADRAEDPWTVVSAWLNALPTDSVLSGPTAAWLHGLDLNPANPVEVIVPLRAWSRSRAGLRVRHCKLESHEVVRIRGRLATSIDRTLRDLAARLPDLEMLI